MAGYPYLERVRALQGRIGPQSALVSAEPDVLQFYTGYRGHGYLLVDRDGACLYVYPVEYGRARDQAATEVVRARERPLPLPLAERLGERLALIDASLPWPARQALGAVQEADEVLASEMAVKDERRVEDFAASVRLALDAYDALLRSVRPGMTERQLADRLHAHMFGQGAERLAFDTIVSSGPRTALCHGDPTDRVVRAGDLVMVDMGPAVGEGEADVSRTFCVGPADERARQVYDAVYRAQKAGVEALRPGAVGGDVDKAARTVLAEAGLGETMVHALGHSIGRGPNLMPAGTDTVVRGAIITVEPGVYIDGWGGVRLEDDCLVGADGARPIAGDLQSTLVEISL